MITAPGRMAMGILGFVVELVVGPSAAARAGNDGDAAERTTEIFD